MIDNARYGRPSKVEVRWIRVRAKKYGGKIRFNWPSIGRQHYKYSRIYFIQLIRAK